MINAQPILPGVYSQASLDRLAPAGLTALASEPAPESQAGRLTIVKVQDTRRHAPRLTPSPFGRIWVHGSTPIREPMMAPRVSSCQAGSVPAWCQYRRL